MAKEHICEVCGRIQRKKLHADGKVVCNKHYKQFKKYGKFLDNNPRTIFDRNEYHINGDVTFIDLYDKNCDKIGEAIIDTEDLDKVKYIKWKLSNSGYAMNTPKYKEHNMHMSRCILGVNTFVDHINGNKLDNRKANLRVCNPSQNQMDVCRYKGYDKLKNGKYNARIKIDQKSIVLGSYVFEEEAQYARWYAEVLVFKEFRYPKEEPDLPESRKQQIREYVENKLAKYNLI